MQILQVLLKAIPIESIVVFIVRKIAPEAPAWVASVVAKAIGNVAKVVKALDRAEYAALSPSQKRLKVVTVGRKLLDDAFDEVPTWGALSEDRRDRIVVGIAELVLFVLDLSAPERRSARKALKD